MNRAGPDPDGLGPVRLEPVGLVRTPHTDREGMPIQPAGARGIRGTVELRPELAEAAEDLSGFSHIILIYHLHRSAPGPLKVVPFMDDVERGVFSTRSPSRPNPIGLSTVRLLSVEGNVLEVEDVDMLDGTPLLDIKPFVPDVDCPEADRFGWLEEARRRMGDRQADDRFV